MAYFLPLPSIKRNPRCVPGIWGEHNLKNRNELNFRSKTQEQGTNTSSILPLSAELSLCNSTAALEFLICPWQQCSDTTQAPNLYFLLIKIYFSRCNKSPSYKYKAITHTELPVPASSCFNSVTGADLASLSRKTKKLIQKNRF